MRTEELDYDLPEHLIATRPVEPRDACRLLVVSRTDDRLMEHARFSDLPSFLCPEDVMVFNTSGVLPARLIGARKDTGGAVEGLFLAEHPNAAGAEWRVMLKSNGKLRAGQVIALGTGDVKHEIELLRRDDECWIVRPMGPGPAGATETLARVGATPLPPYILRQRKHTGQSVDDTADRAWYQTVYAQPGGSVAAPTAGLHFTEALLGRLASMGVARADVRLDVGVGTFKPIESERVEDHPMHAEWARVPGAALEAMHGAKAGAGGGERTEGRVIAVGTTSVRALESVPQGSAGDWEGWTNLMIAPGYGLKRVDALVTNFHLPKSTLLLLVGAFFPGGVGRVKAIYTEAVRREYRFYSYGDAMLILP
ncbi:MAG: tRNA preQ1(34) S-adenosylmethionine ribosyltransferase-isomerase QueA [Phycisphaeraceae bacterium]|nr:tRNA preQ1(34) S-adenosylmethionine ribosyltransferase-isomerase QueA [Phycisphaerales bacterium]MCB9843338.1 tRNA preQ1(34) S-adenosylmethionine ribosyltransferase-isomerase QueA [Phycisphaeraceae bacterium]